jgi:hypothetical protein
MCHNRAMRPAALLLGVLVLSGSATIADDAPA